MAAFIYDPAVASINSLEHCLSMAHLSPQLLATTRICVLSEAEMKNQNRNFFQMVSVENEKNMLCVLATFFSRMLQQCATTMEVVKTVSRLATAMIRSLTHRLHFQGGHQSSQIKFTSQP